MNPLDLIPAPVRIGALVAVIVGALVAGWAVRGYEVEAVQAKFDSFVATTKAEGEAAKKLADAKAESDKKLKENIDASYQTALAALAADNRRMRDARSGISFVPAAAPGSLRPELACFDRAELERSIRDFDRGVSRLIDEGGAKAIGLDSAREWARSIGAAK